MISLRRNSKGQLVEAPGKRIRASSIYSPAQIQPFRISRSKFTDFLNCPRCFYLDRVRGLISPSTPGWTLNETTDLLLKREFDICREQQVPHRLIERFGLANVVPFRHQNINKWRDSLRHGLEHLIPGTNIILHGGVDDLWHDRNRNQLIIVDYKSQASKWPVNADRYLSNVYHGGHKAQLDVYAYLLTKMGFDVSPVGYFYVCNADRSAPAFNGQLVFEETLVPYEWDGDWIDARLSEMAQVLNSHAIPEGNLACENCAYATQRKLTEAAGAYVCN